MSEIYKSCILDANKKFRNEFTIPNDTIFNMFEILYARFHSDGLFVYMDKLSDQHTPSPQDICGRVENLTMNNGRIECEYTLFSDGKGKILKEMIDAGCDISLTSALMGKFSSHNTLGKGSRIHYIHVKQE